MAPLKAAKRGRQEVVNRVETKWQGEIYTRAESDLRRFRLAREQRQLSPLLVDVLAEAATSRFFQAARQGLGYMRPAISLLNEMAALPERELAGRGLRALFPELIEPLNDSFDPAACALHDRILAQSIDYFRRLPEARRLDEALRRDRILTEQDLLDRKERIGRARPPRPPDRVRKIILLSRVTIGADVAVTSVILRHLRALAPAAEVVWLGPAKLAELYEEAPGLRLSAIAYERGGSMLDRLLSWLRLRQAVEKEGSGLAADELWIVDPDSRLTQLGLLPLGGGDRNYYFFESRSHRAPDRERLGELADHWCASQFDAGGERERPFHPFLALPGKERSLGVSVVESLRGEAANNVAVLSLGVGGNERKRIGGRFEQDLIGALLGETKLILDKGGSAEERASVERIVSGLRAEGIMTAAAGEVSPRPPALKEAQLLVWEGGIGSLAGLIAASDGYIGYDSAGQHMAAALGIPALTIFVNNATPIFAERWHPTGPGAIKVWEIAAENARARGGEDLVADAMSHYRGLMAAARGMPDG